MIKNLKELKEKISEYNIPYAFNVFLKPTEPPHLVSTIVQTVTKPGDNKVYLTKQKIMLELTTITKDTKLEKLVEEQILEDMYFEKSETYLADERCYNVTYTIEFEYQ